MQFRHDPTFSDYWALNVYYLKKRGKLFVYLAILMVAIFLISPWLPSMQPQSDGLMRRYYESRGNLFLPGIFLLCFAGAYWGARRRWKTAPELRDAKDYEFSSEGIRIKSDSFDGSCDWKMFKEADITPKYVFIATHQRQFHYFPRSVVPDLNELTALLSSKMPTKVVDRKTSKPAPR